MESTIRTFIMIRHRDETGVSGTGKVLEAVEFSNKFVVAHWCHSRFESINVYKSYEDFIAVHVLPHPSNKTEIIWNDGTIQYYPEDTNVS